MISEYAFGHYAWVLSFMFFVLGASARGRLVVGHLVPGSHPKAGKVGGLSFLMIAGAGEADGLPFFLTSRIP